MKMNNKQDADQMLLVGRELARDRGATLSEALLAMQNATMADVFYGIVELHKQLEQLKEVKDG